MNPCPTCNKPLPAFIQEMAPETQTNAVVPQMLASVQVPEAAQASDTSTGQGPSAIARPAKAIQTIVCDGCARVLDVRGAFPIATHQRCTLPLSHVPLRLRSKGHLGEHDYTVVGWARYEGRDASESWSWESWRLLSETGESHWLSFSPEEGFLLLTPLPVPKACSPDDTHFPVPGGLADKTSRSTAYVSSLAGAFDEPIRLGDSGEYVTAAAAGQSYCFEWVRGSVELFQAHPVSLAEVSKAFGLKRLRLKLLLSAFSAPNALLLPHDTSGLLSLSDEPVQAGALSVAADGGEVSLSDPPKS